MNRRHIAATAVAVVLGFATHAATPPDAINFQAVLRDASGSPLDGSHDMTFRFFDAAAAGAEILVDEHLGAGTGSVTASNGLFNVALGTGAVSDGSGVFANDPYTSITDVFRDFTDVWVEIQIGGETLDPRIQVVSAGHALNADNAEQVDGLDSSQFLRSDQSDSTSGILTAAQLRSNGGLYVDADGPEGTHPLYFYDNGGPAGQSLAWVNAQDRFEFSDDLHVLGDVSADLDLTGLDLALRGDSIQLGVNGPDADRSIYFYDNGSPTAESFFWDSAEDRFTLSDDTSFWGGVYIQGANLFMNEDGPDQDQSLWFYDNGSSTAERFFWDSAEDRFTLSDDTSLWGGVYIQGANLFMNEDGPDQDQSLWFYDAGSATDERFYWNDPADAFYVTDGFIATGELRTHAQQIVINDDGPNGNQDIEFYNNGTQTERFQWDVVAEQFEVSDDFRAFGAIVGDTKNFVQNHPHRDDLEIVYTSLEGNEVTTFTRGTGRLVNGEARIELEESFRYVTNPDIGLSAHLTPRGASSVLYVESIGTGELVVRSDDPDVAFDFVVYGLRVGYEDHPVYRAKRAEAFAPPLGHFEADFAAQPELRRHTALHRYREMAGAALGRTDTGMPGARALREAIGMRELNLDYPRGSDISVREMNRLALEREADEGEIETAHAAETVEVTPPIDQSGTPNREDAWRPVIASRPSPARPIDSVNVVPIDETVEAGDVLVIDAHGTGGMALAREQGDTSVFGVVIEPETGQTWGLPFEVPVASSGIVTVKVDASLGAIRPGDLLTTSPTPGHAMRAVAPGVGSVLGKALEPLDSGSGLIRVLVTLR